MSEGTGQLKFQKEKLIKSSGADEVWLVRDEKGRTFIMRETPATGTVYPQLKNYRHRLWPEVILAEESPSGTAAVEEFVSGTKLSERMESNSPLKESEAKYILLQLCDGLALLHRNGISHRNISPSNIVIQKDGIVRLTGFQPYQSSVDGVRRDISAMGLALKKALPPGYHGWLLPILQKCVSPSSGYASVEEIGKAVIKHTKKARAVRLALAIIAVILAAVLLFFKD